MYKYVINTDLARNSLSLHDPTPHKKQQLIRTDLSVAQLNV